jgi:hypothetical protein
MARKPLPSLMTDRMTSDHRPSVRGTRLLERTSRKLSIRCKFHNRRSEKTSPRVHLRHDRRYARAGRDQQSNLECLSRRSLIHACCSACSHCATIARTLWIACATRRSIAASSLPSSIALPATARSSVVNSTGACVYADSPTAEFGGGARGEYGDDPPPPEAAPPEAPDALKTARNPAAAAVVDPPSGRLRGRAVLSAASAPCGRLRDRDAMPSGAAAAVAAAAAAVAAAAAAAVAVAAAVAAAAPAVRAAGTSV